MVIRRFDRLFLPAFATCAVLGAALLFTRASGSGGQPPVCDAGGPYSGFLGLPLEFDGTGSSDPDGTIVDYVWDFGDGTTGTGPTPSHTYSQFVSYAALTVTDDTQMASTCSTRVDLSVDNMPPVCDAGGPYTGSVGQPVQLDGTRSVGIPPHVLVAYEWDFGDGVTGSGPSPTHTYTQAGAFTVVLTVTDDNGQASSCTTTTSVTTTAVAPTTWGKIKRGAPR
jgi:trimeric autotransporter adhesin